MRRFAGCLLVLTALCVGAASAQEPVALLLEVTAVDTTAHPRISAVLTAPVELGGAPLEPGAVTVAEGGEALPVDAIRLPDDRLEVVLVVDTSGSMRGLAFTSAKEAAGAYVAQLPPTARVALVAFGTTPQVASPLAEDRAALLTAVDGLEATGETALYDAVWLATEQFSGEPDSRRSIIVLSDGGDTASAVSVEDSAAAVSAAGARLDVVELVTTESARSALDQLAAAGTGQVVAAGDPSALTGIYDGLARSLVSQYAFTWQTPTHDATEVTVRLAQGGVVAEQNLRVDYPAAPETTTTAPAVVTTTPAPRSTLATAPEHAWWLLPVGIGAISSALLIVGLIVFLPSRRRRQLDRLGSPAAAAMVRPSTLNGLGVRAAAAAEKALDRNGRRGDLDRRLEQAGISLRAGEFVVFSLCTAIAVAILGVLVAGPFVAVLLSLCTLGAARAALIVLRDKRRQKFSEQLGDTLQLLAGSLRAGYGLLQAIDGLSSEVSEPTSSELRRLVVETRMGRDLGMSMRAMAERLEAEDFDWVVQAIEINREVGGDLAEILDTVGNTIRERNQVQRQVQTLTAEGRMSAYVLIALPLLMAVYQALVNYDSFRLLTFGPGLVMSVVGIVMLSVGGLWFRALCKLDY